MPESTPENGAKRLAMIREAHAAQPYDFKTDLTYCPTSDISTDQCHTCITLAHLDRAEATSAALTRWLVKRSKKKGLPTIPIGTRVNVRNMGVGTVVGKDGYNFDGVAVIFDAPPRGFEEGCCAGVDECEVLTTSPAPPEVRDV